METGLLQALSEITYMCVCRLVLQRVTLLLRWLLCKSLCMARNPPQLPTDSLNKVKNHYLLGMVMFYSKPGP